MQGAIQIKGPQGEQKGDNKKRAEAEAIMIKRPLREEKGDNEESRC